MTLKEQLQKAADEGRQLKTDDEQQAEVERVAAEHRRTLERQADTEAARKELERLPERMTAATRKGDALCTARVIPIEEVTAHWEYRDSKPLDPSTLKGVSLRLFELLQEAELSPSVVALCAGLHVIQIPVPKTAV